jgi:hypothetical protein
MAVRILSHGCAGRHSPFAAAPARTESRCGNPPPIAFPDTLETVPSLCAVAVAPAPKTLWPEEREERAGAYAEVHATVHRRHCKSQIASILFAT